MDRADSDLRYYLQYGKCPEKRWFGCLSSVVRYIHSLDIRHQDIKPENILIKEGRILLADFGLSRNGIGKKKQSHFQWIREYCAPEVENGASCGLPADIFSLGAVFLEMLVARDCPGRFEDLENILKFPSDGTLSYAKNIDTVHLWIEENLRPLGWQDNDEIRSKCREMLRSDPCQRPSAKDLIRSWLLLSASDECKACKCAEDMVTQV
ncbi:kinase-like domain-containing protein [Penicillium canescens]|uniref:Kinase-like domain-containing protein n=1 Tax=Penicillium canescens TaxID=5083 RepID=A0AAD6HYT2_PENCN|nr:kinase-like domain-containing protein [Penicillium canescens]KAJ5981570.1 kinase-like domain-containing protein [Penicillium canescens]KAJ6022302.1 kinase-like domain-containing protein [Penicillium canescens]KAJ6038952.1 kinase-like domain-containing protein [Penicillium canescens]KAJ6066198.1 kinase-like domain-containing protein [Penicillium canescens]KAJ6094341.1 kinase-like domain-containing protein [Penicillium canescens]